MSKKIVIDIDKEIDGNYYMSVITFESSGVISMRLKNKDKLMEKVIKYIREVLE